MKRVFSVLLASILLLSVLLTGTFAATDDDWKNLEFNLLFQNLDGMVYSANNEFFPEGRNCMRGFAVSPDGRYLFAGLLNSNTNSAIEMIDTTTGLPAGSYVYTQENGKRSYPKGLDCDDRGYLYAGLAYSANYGTAHFAVLDYSKKGSDGYMLELSRTQILEVSAPGDSSGTKVGVNGVAVQKSMGRYYLYVIINYDVDFLYRYDVTDPVHPMIDASFGDQGRIDLHDDAYKIGGTDALTEGNYLDIDEDGVIYMGYTTSSGAGLLKLSEDGKVLLDNVAQTKGYGVALYEDYVLCSSQSSGSVYVYNKSTLAPVADFNIGAKIVLPVPESYDKVLDLGVASLCNIKVVNDVIYFADQGSTTAPDQVFAAAITDAGKAEIKKATDVLAALLHVEETSAAPTDAPTAAPTEAPTDAPTEAPTAAPTDAPANTDAPGTKPAEEKKGCKSSAACGLVLVAVLGAAYVSKKR